jgi:hypothetical protein
MAMTLLQMAEKVLKEEKRALTVWDIWQAAKKRGYDKLVDSKGNLPFDSLGGLIHADIRNNPSSIFVALGESPTRFILKSQMENIQPGKQVHMLENIDYVLDDFTHITDVIATKGSIGTILSYQEYIAHTDESARRNGYFVPEHHREWVHSGMRAGTHYPIRFDKVAPLSDEDYAALKEQYTSILVSCRVGVLVILPTASFAVI